MNERVFPIRCSIFEDSPHLIHHGNLQESDDHSVIVVKSPRERAGDGDPMIGASVPEGADVQQAAEACSSPNARDTVPCPEPSRPAEEGLGPSGAGLPTPSTASEQDAYYFEKHEYAIKGSSHGIISRARRTFTQCEDEQIHIPGAIQSFGMLVALKIIDETNFEVRVVSENSYAICHYTPAELLALPNFTRIFPAYQRHPFEKMVQTTRAAKLKSPAHPEPKVFTVSFIDGRGVLIPGWCAMHYVGEPNNLLVCEFELQSSTGMPLIAHTEDYPHPPVNTLNSNPVEAAESTRRKSKPLELPELGLDLFSNDGKVMEVVDVLSQIQLQLSSAPTLGDLLDVIVGVVQDLTKFHRCMVYQFDSSFNGKVVAELVDPAASVDLYKGLQFPASDIPKQARELYKLNKVRILFDRDQESARLVCKTALDLETPLDLTYSYLRAMSPVHLKYLANMGVRSTLSISLDYQGELWGLICCHSYGPTGTRVPFQIRELCYWIGLCASTCVEKLINMKRLLAKQVMGTTGIGKPPEACIAASSQELLRSFQADSGFLVIDGEARTIGKLSSYSEALTLLKYVYFRKSNEIFSSSNISADLEDLMFEPEFHVIAGLMFIPLSMVASDFVVLFRNDQRRTVHWAGNPNWKSTAGPLEPRNSFKVWTETVLGTSAEWTEDDLSTAAMVQLVYGNFIGIWREKESAYQDTRMKRMLLLSASHEVLTPLNAVINYLELALERPLDEATHQILSKSHSASKSLIYVINDLLQITGSSKERIALLEEPFDIKVAIIQAVEPLAAHAQDKSLTLNIVEDSGFPQFVKGDLSRLQQAVTCLVSNAISHTSKGGITVELRLGSETEFESFLEIIVEDTGVGMTEDELDNLFAEFEQVPKQEAIVESPFAGPKLAQAGFPLDPVPDTQSQGESEGSSGILGVGLALVARFIKNRKGTMKVSSAKDKGSIFTLSLPFTKSSGAAHPFQVLAPPHRTRNVSASQMPREPVEPHAYRRSSASVSSASSLGATLQSSPTLPRLDSSLAPLTADTPLVVLVADDNRINVSILQRRLRNMGHHVRISRDGRECFNIFKECPTDIDFILMDIEMPLISGPESTRMIRAFESTLPSSFSRAASSLGRVPIFAVSASLRKDRKGEFIAVGFDGWMHKPINFSRLRTLLGGALDEGCRKDGAYREIQFENGGWFGNE